MRPRPTNVNVQKIDGLILKIHGITLASFLFQNSLGSVRFFEETFLLTNISIKLVLKMLFLTFSNANIEFTELEKLIWRFYTTAKALPTISRIELINQKKFIKAALDKK